MWKQVLLYVAICVFAFLLGFRCGDFINVKYDIEDCDGVLGSIFAILSFFVIYNLDVKANSKKMRHPNQIRVTPEKRLPFYKVNKKLIFYGLPSILLISLPFMWLVETCESYYLGIFVFIAILISTLITLFIILMLLYDKTSLLAFENELYAEFEIIDDENKKDISKECLPALRIIEKDIFNYIYYEYWKMHYEDLIASIGILCYRNFDTFGRTRYYHSNLPYESNIFVTIELPYKLKKATYIGLPENYEEKIGDLEKVKNNLIIPQYDNIPKIFPQDKEYAERILSESVQKQISDLARYIGDFNMEFFEDKITLVIQDARWTNIFDRFFNKEKCLKNVLCVARTILASLKEISEEIEKENDY